MNDHDKRLALGFAIVALAFATFCALTYDEGHHRGLCRGAGGTIERAHGGWYCRGADGRVLGEP